MGLDFQVSCLSPHMFSDVLCMWSFMRLTEVPVKLGCLPCELPVVLLFGKVQARAACYGIAVDSEQDSSDL